jgi:hypothetical protein
MLALAGSSVKSKLGQCWGRHGGALLPDLRETIERIVQLSRQPRKIAFPCSPPEAPPRGFTLRRQRQCAGPLETTAVAFRSVGV